MKVSTDIRHRATDVVECQDPSDQRMTIITWGHCSLPMSLCTGETFLQDNSDYGGGDGGVVIEGSDHYYCNFLHAKY